MPKSDRLLGRPPTVQPMSQRDLTQSLRDLKTLVGRPCYFAAVGTALKLQIDHTEPDAPYLWVDPPWILTHANFRVEATQCPDYADPAYDEKFKEWADSFVGLGKTYLEGFEADAEGAITFGFDEGLNLLVPVDPAFAPEPFSRYDHWYARA